MFWIIKLLGLGIWVAILSTAISSIFIKNGAEQEVTLVYVTIMDFIVIAVAAKTIMKIFKKSS